MIEINYNNMKDIFYYKDGKIFWKDREQKYFKSKHAKANFKKFIGKEAGSIKVFKKYNYKQKRVSINGKQFIVSRIIWVLHNKPLIDGMQIDHINGNSLDNRISNLRQVTPKINSRNTKISNNNTSGIKGIDYKKSCNKWRARGIIDGRRVELGLFENKDDAIKARKEYMEKEGNYTTRHGS